MAQTVEEKREYNRNWRKTHPEKVREASLRYRIAHPEKVREAKRKWHEANAERQRERNHKWYKDHPDQAREKKRRWYEAHPDQHRKTSYKRNYGITPEVYDRILAEQNGVCAICGGHRGVRRLNVDHDHATGEIRGILCSKCNLAIGQMDDNPAWLQKAAEYLRQFDPANNAE